MAKKVIGEIKLQIPAGQANPSPPVGPGFGSAGRQYHGVLQILQCCDPIPAGNDHSCNHHRIRGSLLHVRDEDPTGVGAAKEGRRG